MQFDEYKQEGCEILDGARGVRMSLEGSEHANAKVGATERTAHKTATRRIIESLQASVDV
ncbi:hypothetical protein [uncultured Agrobacterium sp.]|uniref:hypothetical protein n=1 Tax=uncultured Agrobacterium sp. TaxID=157277 RepID=UPI0025E57591|nr:hypothetical protein [uncultured Agrobacterium sp.]